MGLSKRDTEMGLHKISYLEFKYLEMDRVLTAFSRAWRTMAFRAGCGASSS